MARIEPQPGPQRAFLSSPADIAIFGGAAGGGKSYALLLEPLRHIGVKDFSAVVFRRTLADVRKPGSIWDTSVPLYGELGAKPRLDTFTWTFPRGSKIVFGHLEHETTVLDWQGAQIPFIAFDELTHFSRAQFFYLLSRNRSTCGVRPYVRATTNPDADSWVAELIAWWIDPGTGLPIPDRAGALRWFARDGDAIVWGDSEADVASRVPGAMPKSLTFIPAKLEDNAILMAADPGYRANLLALPVVERERLLGGNWKIRPAAGLYFRKEWIIPVERLPPRDSLRIYGASDYAVTASGGDYTVHAVIALDADGNPWLVDLWRKQAASDEWVSAFCDLVRKWKPMAWAEETGQIKSGVGPWLEKAMRERRAHTAREQFPTKGDKAVRAQSFRGLIATRGLRILANAEYRAAFESELDQFPAGVHDDQVDACLVDGTMISMADGSRKPIELVAVGEKVATPIGGCEVVASRVTNESAKVYRLLTAGGHELIATGDHPVHIEHKGFVRVDAICIMDQITLEPSCSAAHQGAKLSSIAGIAIADTLKAGTRHIVGIFTGRNREEGSSTGMFGRMKTALFQRVMTSTTSTETRQTTQSKISRASPKRIIGGSILSSARALTSNLSTLNGFGHAQRSGIQAKAAKSGTEKTVETLGTTASQFGRYARRAVLSLMHSEMTLAFAQRGANNAASEEGAQGAGDMSPKASLQNASAAIACLLQNGQKPPLIAQRHAGCVIATEALSAPARVRNLTVNRAHVFYANGILTHNCGLVGQLLDKMMDGPRKPSPEVIRRDDYSERGVEYEPHLDPLTM
jgi:predicted phage terminase large subunit-like protein